MLFVAKERNKLSVTCAHQESKRFTNYIYSKTQSDNSDCIQCTFIILASNICGLLSKLILTFYYYNSTIKEIDITKSPELISQLRQRTQIFSSKRITAAEKALCGVKSQSHSKLLFCNQCILAMCKSHNSKWFTNQSSYPPSSFSFGPSQSHRSPETNSLYTETQFITKQCISFECS